MGELLSKGFLVAMTIFAGAIIFTLPTMWLWDAVMPDLFSLSTITFWQAMGVNLLAGILFK